MQKYRAIVAYDGARYQGFQRLSEGRASIQSEIERALEKVTRQPIPIIGAARTDTGVHAEGQVIAFQAEWRHDEQSLLRAINVSLPEDIALQRLECVEPGFHPRFDAWSRAYRYQVYESDVPNPLHRHRMWHVWKHHDLRTMNETAEMILGEHDFATFGNPTQGTVTRRTVYRSKWTAQPLREGVRLLTYEVEANGFLHHMVRSLVATMVDVGSGKWTVVQFSDALQAKSRARARQMAPAHGLILTEVTYTTGEPDQGLPDQERGDAPLNLTGDGR